MPSHWNVKALEAQALVGRSYAVYHYLSKDIPSARTNLDAGLSDSQKAKLTVLANLNMVL